MVPNLAAHGADPAARAGGRAAAAPALPPDGTAPTAPAPCQAASGTWPPRSCRLPWVPGRLFDNTPDTLRRGSVPLSLLLCAIAIPVGCRPTTPAAEPTAATRAARTVSATKAMICFRRPQRGRPTGRARGRAPGARPSARPGNPRADPCPSVLSGVRIDGRVSDRLRFGAGFARGGGQCALGCGGWLCDDAGAQR